MQIGGKDIENLIMNMVLKKILKKKTQIWKNTFPCLFIRNGLNIFQFGTIQFTTMTNYGT
jgi:hypothetical protein